MAMTIKKIAELAGVAPTTVSLVLRDSKKIGMETKKRVLKIIEETDYYPNQSGKLLKQGKTDAVAVLSSFFQNIFKMEFVNGVERGIFETDYQLRQFYAQPGFEPAKCKEILFSKMADAVIALNMKVEISYLEKMKKLRKPIILVEDVVPDFPGVTFDNARASYLAVEHFVKSGRRRIALSLGREVYRGFTFVEDRLIGYEKAARDFGLDYSELVDVPDYSLESGRALCRWFLETKDKPDALFCASGDMTAAGFLQEALASGVKVPDDIAIMGFDDSIIAQSTSLGLTTVRQPVQEMGRASFELAQALMEEQNTAKWSETKVFEPQIVVRQSG